MTRAALVMPSIPDELCGFAGCVFLADHTGRHSWHTGRFGS